MAQFDVPKTQLSIGFMQVMPSLIQVMPQTIEMLKALARRVFTLQNHTRRGTNMIVLKQQFVQMLIHLIQRRYVMLCGRISILFSFTALPLKVGEKPECEPEKSHKQRANIRPGHPRKGALILRRTDVVTQCKQAHRHQKSQSVINHRASPFHGLADTTRRLTGSITTIRDSTSP